MENFWTNSTVWKKSVLASSICVTICLLCEIAILGLLENHSSWSGMSAMYLAIFFATLLSATLQTSYMYLKHHAPLLNTFKLMFFMVIISMLGMGTAELFLHNYPQNNSHNEHTMMQNTDTNAQIDTNTHAKHIHEHAATNTERPANKQEGMQMSSNKDTNLTEKMYMYHAMTTPFAIFIMLFGGLLTLIPYNYYRIKIYGKLH